MKYSTVQIKPNSKNKLEVSFYDIPYDRENKITTPYPCGFWHYKRSIGEQAALEGLKSVMIGAALDEIQKLTEYIREVEALKVPKSKTKKGIDK